MLWCPVSAGTTSVGVSWESEKASRRSSAGRVERTHYGERRRPQWRFRFHHSELFDVTRPSTAKQNVCGDPSSAIYPQTGMNAVLQSCRIQYLLPASPQPRLGAAISETLDIGSLGWLVARSWKGITMRS